MRAALHEIRAGVRVTVALGRADRSGAIVERLASDGFDVVSVSGIGCAADHVGPGRDVVVIVDDGGPRWLREVSDLVRSHPEARLLALVDIRSPEEFLTILTAGVTGFVSPAADVGAIVRSLEALLDSGVAIPRGMVPALVDVVRHGRGRSLQTAAGRVDVTDREWEILELLVQGRTTREMANALYISVGTVRSHVSTLLRKVGAVSRDDAIRVVARGSL